MNINEDYENNQLTSSPKSVDSRILRSRNMIDSVLTYDDLKKQFLKNQDQMLSNFAKEQIMI